MRYNAINIGEKFQKFNDHWSPKVIAEINNYQMKLVKFQGDFVWHNHPDIDEVFMVFSGELRIDFKDGDVTIKEGELYVVPKGKEHKPFAQNECQIMLIEPQGVTNTGDTIGDKTAANNIWI